MFTLTIANRQLILAPDFGVPLLYKNACWCFNEIPAPLCPDITVPDNDVNRNILGFPGRFAKMARSNDRKFPRAELRWRGYLYIFGTLVITKADENGYSGYIQSELRSLSDSQREKLIGDHNLLGELTFENKPNYDPDTDLYCTIRLHNAGFFVDKGETEPWKKPVLQADGSTKTEDTEREVLTRKFQDTATCMVNATGPAGVKTYAGYDGAVVVSPFPFVTRLIELLLRDNKFFMRENFMATHAALKQLCLYTNTSICKTEVFTQAEAAIFLDKYHVDIEGSIDPISLMAIQMMGWLSDTFYLKKLLPKLELNELLLSVQNLTNTFFHFSGIDDVDNIDRESLFELEPFDLSKYRVSRWLPGTRQNLCLKFKFSHDSDDQEFNENFKDLSSREADIKDPVAIYAALADLVSPAIGEIRLVESEKMFYEYRQETVDNKDALMWAPISIDIQDYNYNPSGDESEDIETKFSTLRMHENGYPIAYQKGNNSQFAQFSENFTPRLLFYNGNNTGGATATNGLSVDWKSLVTERYRRTAPFYANALPVEANFRFPGNIFYKVLNEIYKPYLDRDGSFFIKEMQVQANNSEYVDATLTVFKNEDNVFDTSSGTVEGSGEHAGSLFTPKFIGITESGWPTLVDAAGLYRPIPVFGDISTLTYAGRTCVDYSAADKLLFVGGNNGQLHVCDLADMDNIRYKTIQVWNDAYRVSSVSLVDNGVTKTVMVGKSFECNLYAQPYHPVFDSYISSEAVQTAVFDHGTGRVRGVLWYNGHYYACTGDGEVHRTANLAILWNQLADIDASFINIRQSATRLLVAELDDDMIYAEKSNPTQFIRFGLAGTPRQKVRDMQPMLADQVIYLCDDDNACIWMVDPGVSNGNITPPGIKNAGGACFDGAKYAYISVKDGSDYTKIAKYNADWHTPEVVWSYLNVPLFFTKLYLY